MIDELDTLWRAIARTFLGLGKGIGKSLVAPRQQLTIMSGLPGSGKTTAAEKLADDDTVVLSRDDGLSAEEEESRIEKELSKGNSVIADDTNLSKERMCRLRNIADQTKSRLHIVDLRAVSPEECIERDGQREDPVGAAAILSHHKKIDKPHHPKTLFDSHIRRLWWRGETPHGS